MHWRTLAAIFLVVVASCGDDKPTIQPLNLTGLSGEFDLVKVTCNGEESTAVPSTSNPPVIPTFVSQTFLADGNRGKHVTSMFGCVRTIVFSKIEYPSATEMVTVEEPASCENASAPACASAQKACSLAGARRSYSAVFDGSILKIGRITAVEGESSPCGPGQSTENVIFHFKKK